MKRKKYYYHVAETKHLEKILNEGLNPKLRKDAEVKFPVVYFAETPKMAIGLTKDALDPNDPDTEVGLTRPSTLLKITIPKEFKIYEDPESFEEGFYVKRAIPSKNIKPIRILSQVPGKELKLGTPITVYSQVR